MHITTAFTFSCAWYTNVNPKFNNHYWQRCMSCWVQASVWGCTHVSANTLWELTRKVALPAQASQCNWQAESVQGLNRQAIYFSRYFVTTQIWLAQSKCSSMRIWLCNPIRFMSNWTFSLIIAQQGALISFYACKGQILTCHFIKLDPTLLESKADILSYQKCFDLCTDWQDFQWGTCAPWTNALHEMKTCLNCVPCPQIWPFHSYVL